MTISPRVRVWPARLPNEPTPIDGHVGHVVHVLGREPAARALTRHICHVAAVEKALE